MSGFPQQVQTQPAPAVSGDFCSANPYFSVNAGQGAFVAGASLQVGRFCWVDPTNAILNNSGSGLPTGFVGRNQQGVITQFLAESSNQIVPGTQCMCFSGGDFWMLNSGLLAAAVGMKAYALFASGLITFAPTGTPPGLASGSSSSVAPETFSLTGSIAVVSNPVGTLQANTGNEEFGVLSVPTTPASGTVYPGATITGTGVQAGTKIVSQLTGTLGGAGTYIVNIPQTVASTTISGAYGLLTIGGTVVAGFGIGSELSGAGLTATAITANASNGSALTGAGAAGTYVVDVSQTVGPIAIDATSGIETKWVCMSNGQTGEVVKTSSQPLG